MKLMKTIKTQLKKKIEKLKKKLQDAIKNLNSFNTNYTNKNEISIKYLSLSTKIVDLETKLNELNKKITDISNDIFKTNSDEKQSKENDIKERLKTLDEAKDIANKYNIPEEYKILIINELELYIKLYIKKEEINGEEGKTDENKIMIYEEFMKLYDKFIILHNEIILKLSILKKDVNSTITKKIINIDNIINEITDIFKLSIYNKNTIDNVIFDLETKLIEFLNHNITPEIKNNIENLIDNRKKVLTI